VRYGQGDTPPELELPNACWYILAISLVTILSCAVAPLFEVLRKIRWMFWIVTFGLWVGATIWTYKAIGWKGDGVEGYNYCAT
jgi:uncharacterized membrane protein YdbT with pleckstrin-like domain